jgi:hypothetical protein
MRRCSYCTMTGHNRRTCSKLKKYISDNPTSFAARRDARAKAEKKPSTRRCSFCNTVGHTKRTCESRRSSTAVVTTKNRSFRRKLRRALARGGWLPGALVRFTPKVNDAMTDRQISDTRQCFDKMMKSQDNLPTAMIVGYDTSALNFDYFQGTNRADAIWVMSPTGKRSRIPLPDAVGNVVEGVDVAVNTANWTRPVYQHWGRPWTFMSIEIAAVSTVKTPRRFLAEHLGEMFWSGKTNSQEMVDEEPHRYSAT